MGAKSKTLKLLDEVITTGESAVIQPLGINRVLQMHGSVSATTGSAECDILASLDGVGFSVIDTLTIALDTTVKSDFYEMRGAWRDVKVNLKTLTGTDATVSVLLGCDIQ